MVRFGDSNMATRVAARSARDANGRVPPLPEKRLCSRTIQHITSENHKCNAAISDIRRVVFVFTPPVYELGFT